MPLDSLCVLVGFLTIPLWFLMENLVNRKGRRPPRSHGVTCPPSERTGGKTWSRSITLSNSEIRSILNGSTKGRDRSSMCQRCLLYVDLSFHLLNSVFVSLLLTFFPVKKKKTDWKNTFSIKSAPIDHPPLGSVRPTGLYPQRAHGR